MHACMHSYLPKKHSLIYVIRTVVQKCAPCRHSLNMYSYLRLNNKHKNDCFYSPVGNKPLTAKCIKSHKTKNKEFSNSSIVYISRCINRFHKQFFLNLIALKDWAQPQGFMGSGKGTHRVWLMVCLIK